MIIRRCKGVLYQLAQKRLGWHNGWPLQTETVGFFIGNVHHNLKRVSGFDLCLKVSERRRKLSVLQFYLDKEPRFTIPYHKKIDFAFLLIAEVAQFELAKSKVGPSFY